MPIIKFYISLIILFFIISTTKAQQQDSIASHLVNSAEIKSLNKIGLYAFGIGLEREQKISRASAISVGISYQFASLKHYLNTTSYNKPNYDMIETNLFPGASLAYKYYYNLKQRLKKGKKIEKNSASYLGIGASGIFPSLFKPYQYDYQISIFPNWGFQRKVGRSSIGELGIGPAIYFNQFETNITLGLTAGFAITF